MQTYAIRHNTKHRGYILVSCSHGHTIESINTGPTFGGSAAHARLSWNLHKCSDCEAAGLTKI